MFAVIAYLNINTFLLYGLVTESGDVCVLPFTYKEKSYNKCISEDKLRPWCPTSSDFKNNEKWDYCSSGMPNIKRRLVCNLGFIVEQCKIVLDL